MSSVAQWKRAPKGEALKSILPTAARISSGDVVVVSTVAPHAQRRGSRCLAILRDAGQSRTFLALISPSAEQIERVGLSLVVENDLSDLRELLDLATPAA